MELIRGSEFVAQVTQASGASAGAPAGQWVVCYLFKESHPGCQLMGACLEELAAKYAATKFVRCAAVGAGAGAGLLRCAGGCAAAAARAPSLSRALPIPGRRSTSSPQIIRLLIKPLQITLLLTPSR